MSSKLKIKSKIIILIFYYIICWHYADLIFTRKNLIYYPQFSKVIEADKYQINVSALITPQKLPSCSFSQKLLIGVVSMPSEIGRRQAIRNSWANNTNVNSTFTKVVFIIGKTESQKVSIESQQYQDIIFTEIHENYYNLSLKTFAVLDFAYKQCFYAECVIKTDSDNILNVAGFEKLCQKQIASEELPLGYIGGACDPSLDIHREYQHKWHVPYFVYAEEKFPKYCSSGAYAYFGQNAWQTIYKSIFESQFFYSSNMRHLPEDIIFTGILASYTGIPRIIVPGFSFHDNAKIVCSENRTLSYSIHLHRIKQASDETEAITSSAFNFLRYQNHTCSAPIN